MRISLLNFFIIDLVGSYLNHFLKKVNERLTLIQTILAGKK